MTRRALNTLVLLLAIAGVLLLLVPHSGSTPVVLFLALCAPLLFVPFEFTQTPLRLGEVRWHAISASPERTSRFQIPPPTHRS